MVFFCAVICMYAEVLRLEMALNQIRNQDYDDIPHLRLASETMGVYRARDSRRPPQRDNTAL